MVSGEPFDFATTKCSAPFAHKEEKVLRVLLSILGCCLCKFMDSVSCLATFTETRAVARVASISADRPYFGRAGLGTETIAQNRVIEQHTSPFVKSSKFAKTIKLV